MRRDPGPGAFAIPTAAGSVAPADLRPLCAGPRRPPRCAALVAAAGRMLAATKRVAAFARALAGSRLRFHADDDVAQAAAGRAYAGRLAAATTVTSGAARCSPDASPEPASTSL